jgi:asparagine synthetase B (glutamine-hydrolysing)
LKNINIHTSWNSNFDEIANYGALVFPRTLSTKNHAPKIQYPLRTKKRDKLVSSDLTKTLEELLLQGIDQSMNGESMFLLSGGMDSSVLLKLMSLNGLAPETTYSTSYPFLDKRGDIEKNYALEAAKLLNISEHVHISCSMSDYFISLIDASIAFSEGVYFMQSPLMFNMFNKAAADLNNRDTQNKNDKTFTVINGMAADCMLGTGYHRRIFNANNLHKHSKLISKLGALNFVPSRVNSLLDKIIPMREMLDYYDLCQPKSSAKNMIWKFNHHRNYELIFANNVESRIGSFDDEIQQCENDLDLLTHLDMRFEMIRSKQEWNAYIKFCTSENSRVYFPFMDSDIWDFLQSIPWEYRLKEHKKVLLDLGRKLGLDDEFLLKPKTGMSVNPNNAIKEFKAFFKCIDAIHEPPHIEKCQNSIKPMLNVYRTWLSILINEDMVDIPAFKNAVISSLKDH